MELIAWLGLFLPLIGFIVILASSNVITRALAGIIACSTVLISFLSFCLILLTYSGTPINLTLYHWLQINGLNADFGLLIDPLSLVMALIITGVGFLIHVYSNGYMDHDDDFARYFACLNFFVFSMLLLVLAGNLFLLYVGWEGVGLASYLLIGFWYYRTAPAQAATKAFVMNRIGDLGLLLGLLLTFKTFGTSNLSEITSQAAQGGPILGLLTLLYFIGATGKSAQLPLYSWLPDAMEGPTPVSALIHAATMVTAGVYLVVRMNPLFTLAPETLYIVGIVGAATALFASLCAMGQIDLKRVLAYSTVSQLGLMFVACSAGAFYGAMFHLTTHAFIKALLFLSAGNVVHMMDGTTDMNQMGGLSKNFPKTHWLFLIGVLALSAIPPLAAFFSKDLILEQTYLVGYKTLYYVCSIASILTAYYLTRAYCLTFAGKASHDVEEAPEIMVVPVSILALFSIIGGFLGYILEGFLAKAGVTLAVEETSLFTPITLVSVIGAFFGIGAAVLLYKLFPESLKKPIALLRKAFYVDEIYNAVIVKPIEALSKFIANVSEPEIFDGSINVAINSTQSVAGWMQKLQSGQIRSYVAWMVVGAVLILAYIVF